MKKIVLGFALAALFIPVSQEATKEIGAKTVSTYHIGTPTIKNAEKRTLKIYNCEDYIYEDDDQRTMADLFADWYAENYGEEINVQYDCYDTNETMYNQVSQLGKQYDLIVASDYMIEKMRSEDLLLKFDAASIPNYTSNLSPYLKNIFDSNGYSDYAAAYMWGTMGLVYNPANVSDEDVQTWEVLWNSKYKNKISVKDSMRDTYILGIFKAYKHVFDLLGEQYEAGLITSDYYKSKVNEYINLCDDATLEEVEDALTSLKENIYGFEVDSGKNDIVTGKIDINFAWSGDAAYAIELAAEENDCELRYSLPEEGSNIWFDGFCMLKGAQTDLAQAFINYISAPENAVLNMDYVGYTCAIAGEDVLAYLHENYDAEEGTDELYELDLSYFFGDTVDASSVTTISAEGSEKLGALNARFPSLEAINRCGMMHDFGSERNLAVVAMWARARASRISYTTYIILGCIALVGIGFGTHYVVKKVLSKKRRQARRAQNAAK